MIPQRFRFWASGADVIPDDNATWEIIDWDSRRCISVTVPEHFAPEEETNVVEALKLIVDDLDLNVTKITLTDEGKLVSCSTSAEDDTTRFVLYPRFTETEAGGDHLDCLKRSQLTEVDRLHVCVDLVRHNEQNNPPDLVVFKYVMIPQRLDYMWKEAFLTKRLKGHPNIIPFHKFIIDDIEPWLLGFTTTFIPGGTLEQQQYQRSFQKIWLKQLMNVVDDLNLKHGIIHQDIAARNLLIDPSNDNLLLFDFHMAARVGAPDEMPARNDVKGVIFTLYESLTHNNLPEEQDVDKIEALQEWNVKAEIEPSTDVKTLRLMVTKWAHCRRANPVVESKPPTPLNWPSKPNTDKVDKVIVGGELLDWSDSYWYRRDVSTGERIVRWERTPYSKLLQ
jgi:Protein kinase domain